jgi:hypothetical protein
MKTLTDLKILTETLFKMAFRKPPVILKSTTVRNPLQNGIQEAACDFEKYYRKPLQKLFEFSSIITGLWNILQNHMRLPEKKMP